MGLSHKYTIICDEVRTENTGKLILIGVYTSGILAVTQLPVVMHALTFYQVWESDRPGLVDIKVKIQHLESGQVLIEARAGMQVTKPGIAPAPLRLGPLQFSAVGAYNMIVTVDGQERDPVVVDFTVQLNLQPQVQQPMGQR